MRGLVAWLQKNRIQHIVMESSGIYWKSVFSHQEAAGLPARIVNAFHVKNVPGRKGHVSDSEWLAQLARFGRLRGSFIPPKELREAHSLPLPAQIDSDFGRGKESPA
jgi:transposase